MTEQRLIEAGFPCHQVGAETQRERGASSALPPLYYLHVWWARRPLTPSRAAILASLLPADADPEEFIKRLGIRVMVADVLGVPWVLVEPKLLERIEHSGTAYYLPVDQFVRKAFERERKSRQEGRKVIDMLIDRDVSYREDPTIDRWRKECADLPNIGEVDVLSVSLQTGDPAWAKERIEFEDANKIRTKQDKYRYPRAYTQPVVPTDDKKVILDPTSGGGSIPFEALRLGHKVIANELNPVSSVILAATLKFPAKYGTSLIEDLQKWGEKLKESVRSQIAPFFPASRLPGEFVRELPDELDDAQIEEYLKEFLDGFLYCRQVTCPHCGGAAPLLNSSWLSKEGEKWAVDVQPQADKTVRFEPYRIEQGNRGRNGDDLDAGTVTRGDGACVHCRQAIDGDEIKRQARGESEHGKWEDTLYCVAAIRLDPQVDDKGRVKRYASGARKGEVKTKKVRFFRAPNADDLQALADAGAELERRRVDFEMKGLVPNEPFPEGNDMRPVTYGMPTWADMFTPRQLLGHLTVMEALHAIKLEILSELGEDRGRAVITYLQFAIDKVVDYNSRQNRWIPQRGSISGTFSRHDFSLKWTFGEMVFAGPSSGFAWGLSQVLDAYTGIATLLENRAKKGISDNDIHILQGSATDMKVVANHSVDAIVMDPPYYDNVQYSELSDFYYVWQKRTLGDLYPGWFDEPVTEKSEEAVANPARDGSAKNAKTKYSELMAGIFEECGRALKPDGIMTVMFTHKSQEAWEVLTKSLIEGGWDVTGTYPVDSEFSSSTHQLDQAAAASTIFLACRPANRADRSPSSWSYEVKAELESAVREGLAEFEELKLGPVDRMIAAWGRALRVYSAHWPVLDGDEEVAPTRAMQEAARVVAEEEVRRLSGGLITVEDLDDETRMAVIALGINGLGDFAYDDALQLSRSLNFRLQQRNGNYRVTDAVVVYANQAEGQLAAPLAKKGSRLHLLKPEQRLRQRLDNPQTLWDGLCGLIVVYREGGIVAARNYLHNNGYAENQALRGLLKVWSRECREDDLKREARLIDYEL